MSSTCALKVIVLLFVLLNGEAHGFFGIPNIQFGASFNIQNSQDAQANLTLNNLITDSQGMVQHVENEIISFIDNMENITNGVREISERNLSRLIEEATERAAAFLNISANLGENIANCTQERISDLETVANATLANIEQCFADKLQQGLNITNQLWQNYETAGNITDDLVQGYANCLRLGYGNIFFIVSPNVLACKLRLINDNRERLTTLGSDIILNVTEGSTYLASLKGELSACVFLNLLRAANTAAAISSEVAMCIILGS